MDFIINIVKSYLQSLLKTNSIFFPAGVPGTRVEGAKGSWFLVAFIFFALLTVYQSYIQLLLYTNRFATVFCKFIKGLISVTFIGNIKCFVVI